MEVEQTHLTFLQKYMVCPTDSVGRSLFLQAVQSRLRESTGWQQPVYHTVHACRILDFAFGAAKLCCRSFEISSKCDKAAAAKIL